MAEKKQRKWRLIVNIVTIVALAAFLFFARDQISETISNLTRVNAWALILMIPAQFFNYDSYARMYRQLFYMLGKKIQYWRMFRITMELNFVNNVFPSGGVSGFSYFGLRMKSQDIRATQATLVQMVRFILLFISFQILLFLGLVMLAIDGKANDFLILIAGSLATLLLVGTLISGYIIGSKSRINSFFTYFTRVINKVIHIVRPNRPEAISILKVQHLFTDLHDNYMIFKRNKRAMLGPLKFALLANLAEVFTIYIVYIAFGAWVNPGAVIIAYAVANFAGLISVLPGGVGIYEALMTAVLVSAGIPATLSLPVTIMYRVLNMSLQLPPGYYFYHKAIQDNNLPAP